jgi:hypothetical protein
MSLGLVEGCLILNDFVYRNGRDPGGRDPLEKELRDWIFHMRRLHGLGMLTQAQAELLETIPGWRWSGSRSASWDSNYLEYLRYVNTYNCLPREKVFDPPCTHRLARWARYQREMQGRCGPGLAPERVAKLEKIPGWYWWRA